jgi:hypothetical protein
MNPDLKLKYRLKLNEMHRRLSVWSNRFSDDPNYILVHEELTGLPETLNGKKYWTKTKEDLSKAFQRINMYYVMLSKDIALTKDDMKIANDIYHTYNPDKDFKKTYWETASTDIAGTTYRKGFHNYSK